MPLDCITFVQSFVKNKFSGYEVVTCGQANSANVTGAVLQSFVTNAPEPVVDTDFIICALCAWLYHFQIVGHLLSLWVLYDLRDCRLLPLCVRGSRFTGCNVTYAGRCVPTFRDSLSVSHLQV